MKQFDSIYKTYEWKLDLTKPSYDWASFLFLDSFLTRSFTELSLQDTHWMDCLVYGFHFLSHRENVFITTVVTHIW